MLLLSQLSRRLYCKVLPDKPVAENVLTLQKWLKASETGAARIRAGLPVGWPVGDKTGTAPEGKAYCDVAIIWPSSSAVEVKPVILAVYSDRPKASADRVNAGIADVAKAAARLIG